MSFCLTKPLAQELTRRLKKNKITPKKLDKMTTEERHAYFADFLGEENAKQVNALVESKLISQNVEQGLMTAVKQLLGKNLRTKSGVIEKVEKALAHDKKIQARIDAELAGTLKLKPGESIGQKILDTSNIKQFKADLVNKIIGTPDIAEAKKIIDLSNTIRDLKAKIPENAPDRSPTVLDYGSKLTELKNYIAELKLKGQKFEPTEYLKHPGKIITGVSGFAKSSLSTLDNSFFGRQGIKTLYTHPSIWGINFAKSWADMYKQAGVKAEGKGLFATLKDPVMNAIKTDLFSRQNARNGKYDKMRLDIGLNSEEAFPTSLPERIPIIGRLFKMSEVAFNGAALRMRADLADKIIQIAKNNGIDTNDVKEMEGLGTLTNSMTGRGDLGKANVLSKEINTTFFSLKFLKSNFDTLTMHLLDPKATPFSKKQSAKNLLKIIGSIGAILAIAHQLNPDNEIDPRGTNFGKIKVGKHTIDITGGLGGLVTLASRLIPTLHNGKWGFWNKSSTGKWTDLTAGKYGQTTALDVFDNFFQGKLAPLAGLLRDIWKGQDYNFKKVTPLSALKQLTVPLSIQQFQKLMSNKDTIPAIISYMILDGLGFGVNIIK